MLKEIPDFEGYYISDDGVVYSSLGQGCRDKTKRVSLYPLKPRMTAKGYLRVYMRKSSTNKRVDRYIHTLVAEAFLQKPDIQGLTINHKDFDKSNNNVTNLEWTTQIENLEYSIKAGRIRRDAKTGRYIKLN